jgi:T5orf172 domain-containing protein
MKADYKAGYLYVLVHPSDPDLYKIGVTLLRPEKRLAQHNSQLDKHAGRIVKETGQKWELKTYIAVPDQYWAERAFWGATPFPDFPFRRGEELKLKK